jgi:hypothetical protein
MLTRSPDRLAASHQSLQRAGPQLDASHRSRQLELRQTQRQQLTELFGKQFGARETQIDTSRRTVMVLQSQHQKIDARLTRTQEFFEVGQKRLEILQHHRLRAELEPGLALRTEALASDEHAARLWRCTRESIERKQGLLTKTLGETRTWQTQRSAQGTHAHGVEPCHGKFGPTQYFEWQGCKHPRETISCEHDGLASGTR